MKSSSIPSSLQPPASSLSRQGAFALIWLVAAAASSATFAGDIASEYAQANSSFAGRLDELADWCEQQGLQHEARRTSDWRLPADPQRFYAIVLDNDGPGGDEGTDEWQTRFRRLRDEHAKALFRLAGRAAAEKDVWLAYRLVWATVRQNPDHEPARKALGFKQVYGLWLTRFEADKRRAKQVWHDRFGWLAVDHVDRYEQGERYYAGSWMSEARERGIRTNMARAWSIPTEHFVVKTNHSLEAGVRLATRLERLYDVWRQMFVGYYATSLQIERMIAGRPLRPHSPRRHQVVYFHSRDEYIENLRRPQPNIDITTGIYLGDKRIAYFFAAADEDHGTQYHEITHQLFSESRAVVPDIGRQANFWIVEGVACYMESLASHQGRYAVGGLETERLVAARYRLLEDGFYVPLAEFNTLGMEALQRDPRIRTLYSQATGWTHFLIHSQNGRYRRALTDYLVAVYTGRDRANTLAELTRTDYETLDRQYREFFEGLE